MSGGGTPRVELLPVPSDALRYFIRMDGRHAGGITVHSLHGDAFSYGIAIARDMRGRGAATAALTQLYARMRAQGWMRAVIRVRRGNAPSLALHKKLGFTVLSQCGDVLTLQKRFE